MKTINMGGKAVRITARRAMFFKLLSMALSGDLRAMSLLLKADGLNESVAQPDALTGTEAKALLADYVRRQGSGNGGGNV